MRDHLWRDVSIDHCGRKALILSVLRQNSMGEGQRKSERFKNACNRQLTFRVGVRMQQTDRNRLSAGMLRKFANLCERSAIEGRRDSPIEVGSSTDSKSHMPFDQWFRSRRR